MTYCYRIIGLYSYRLYNVIFFRDLFEVSAAPDLPGSRAALPAGSTALALALLCEEAAAPRRAPAGGCGPETGLLRAWGADHRSWEGGQRLLHHQGGRGVGPRPTLSSFDLIMKDMKRIEEIERASRSFGRMRRARSSGLRALEDMRL